MTRVPHSRLLFAAAVFLASFLLFLVEPIAAKQLLPFLGGSAAVWITCLVFFQTALLCAYVYAHWLTPPSALAVASSSAAAALALAFFWAFGGVDLSQRASASRRHHLFRARPLDRPSLPRARLYQPAAAGVVVAASKAQRHSLPPLRALEPRFAAGARPLIPRSSSPTSPCARSAWLVCGFAASSHCSPLLLTHAHAARPPPVHRPSPRSDAVAQPPATPRSRKLLWLLLPMGASMQLSAVTSYITANIAPIPLLWILPLGVYLITIILAFEFPRLLPRGIVVRFLAVMLAGLAYMLSQVDVTLPMRIGIVFFLFELLVACLFCHSRGLRAATAARIGIHGLLSLFAAGGALGSFSSASPFRSFSRSTTTSRITFFVTALLALCRHLARRLAAAPALVRGHCLLCWCSSSGSTSPTSATPPSPCATSTAALRVKQNFGFPGRQCCARSPTARSSTAPRSSAATNQRKTPTTYYALDSGVGLALRFCCLVTRMFTPRNIGVIGLGAGTIAAYGQPGDRIRFYEINPAVPPIARNVFTYIRESGRAGRHRRRRRAHLARPRAAAALQRPGGRRILRRRHPAAPAHCRGPRALSPPSRARRHPCLPHLQPARRSRTRHRAAGAIGRHEGDARLEPGQRRARRVQRQLGAGQRQRRRSSPSLQVAAAARPPILKPGLRLWTDDYSSLLPLLRW